MNELRDYRRWHKAYDDPGSELSWRLVRVRGCLREALDARVGPIRVLSACAGDGRDILGTLAGRPDADRVTVTLVEIDPELSDRARTTAAEAGLHVDVRTRDAGTSDAYLGAVPADIVLLVGLLGNISAADVALTVAAAPQLCAPGATCLWSRGVQSPGDNDDVRSWFTEASFVELDYAQWAPDGGAAIGLLRYDGPPVELVPGQHLFTFLR